MQRHHGLLRPTGGGGGRAGREVSRRRPPVPARDPRDPLLVLPAGPAGSGLLCARSALAAPALTGRSGGSRRRAAEGRRGRRCGRARGAEPLSPVPSLLPPPPRAPAPHSSCPPPGAPNCPSPSAHPRASLPPVPPSRIRSSSPVVPRGRRGTPCAPGLLSPPPPVHPWAGSSLTGQASYSAASVIAPWLSAFPINPLRCFTFSLLCEFPTACLALASLRAGVRSTPLSLPESFPLGPYCIASA